MELILRDGDHERGDARDRTDHEDPEQRIFFRSRHLDFPQNDDGSEQKAESEYGVNHAHADGGVKGLMRVTFGVTFRFCQLNERLVVVGTAHPKPNRIGDHVQGQDGEEPVIDPSPRLRCQPGDAAIEGDDGHFDQNRPGKVDGL